MLSLRQFVAGVLIVFLSGCTMHLQRDPGPDRALFTKIIKGCASESECEALVNEALLLRGECKVRRDCVDAFDNVEAAQAARDKFGFDHRHEQRMAAVEEQKQKGALEEKLQRAKEEQERIAEVSQREKEQAERRLESERKAEEAKNQRELAAASQRSLEASVRANQEERFKSMTAAQRVAALNGACTSLTCDRSLAASVVDSVSGREHDTLSQKLAVLIRTFENGPAMREAYAYEVEERLFRNQRNPDISVSGARNTVINIGVRDCSRQFIYNYQHNAASRTFRQLGFVTVTCSDGVESFSGEL